MLEPSLERTRDFSRKAAGAWDCSVYSRKGRVKGKKNETGTFVSKGVFIKETILLCNTHNNCKDEKVRLLVC